MDNENDDKCNKDDIMEHVHLVKDHCCYGCLHATVIPFEKWGLMERLGCKNWRARANISVDLANMYLRNVKAILSQEDVELDDELILDNMRHAYEEMQKCSRLLSSRRGSKDYCDCDDTILPLCKTVSDDSECRRLDEEFEKELKRYDEWIENSTK